MLVSLSRKRSRVQVPLGPLYVLNGRVAQSGESVSLIRNRS